MTDPTQAGQPTEEELRAYLEQLRGADPAELLVQAYRLLGTGAEVKLGRTDARVLIDAMAAMVEAVAGQLPAELVTQMRDGVGQLQMAQVQAEREGASGSGGGQDRAPGGSPEGGAPSQPPPPPGTQPPPPGDDQRLTDRLWIPGRGPSQ